jgi:hypothetical protein
MIVVIAILAFNVGLWIGLRLNYRKHFEEG